MLIELGADANIGEDQLGTPLHSVMRVCHLANAELLIRHGAHVDAFDRDARTASAWRI